MEGHNQTWSITVLRVRGPDDTREVQVTKIPEFGRGPHFETPRYKLTASSVGVIKETAGRWKTSMTESCRVVWKNKCSQWLETDEGFVCIQ